MLAFGLRRLKYWNGQLQVTSPELLQCRQCRCHHLLQYYSIINGICIVLIRITTTAFMCSDPTEVVCSLVLVCLSVCLFVCPSVCLSVCVLACLLACLLACFLCLFVLFCFVVLCFVCLLACLLVCVCVSVGCGLLLEHEPE